MDSLSGPDDYKRTRANSEFEYHARPANGTAQTMTSSVANSTASLRYRFGELSLFTARIPVWRVPGSLSAAFKNDLKVSETLPGMPPRARALVVPSCPVDLPHATLNLTRKFIRYTPVVGPHYYLELRETLQDYLQSHFAAKTRHNLTRSMRKFTEFSGGQIDFREYRKPLQMPEFQTCACAISRLTYQHRLLRVGLPDTPEFLEQLTASAHADNVRGYLLFHAGIPVAFAYCYREDERLYYNTIGYDPSFSSWSPGTILLLLVLQRVCGERCFRIFDFGPGKAPYKSMFASGYVLCGDVYYFRWGLLNLIIVTSHAMVELISTSLGRFLERFGLKRRARDLLRRWSQRSSVI